jgi:ribonuclease P/MRP protein subunit POP5
VFQVVRVSGTIRKAEEEAIRRAREMILKTRREVGEEGDSTLTALFGGNAESTNIEDVLMVDRSDSEDEPSDGNG